MKSRRKEKLIGLIALTLGVGVLSVIVIPTIGWVIFAGIILICAGLYLLRKC